MSVNITADRDFVPSPAGRCDICAQDIFRDELVHVIDGFVVCAECFEEFVFDYFSDNMVLGALLKEDKDGNID
ncbi:MAG: hypothetical protein IJ072_04275 [Oscillospiraceae bacterium]|nr:hypothetical protein [Oscillospiraceae bacterium]